VWLGASVQDNAAVSFHGAFDAMLTHKKAKSVPISILFKGSQDQLQVLGKSEKATKARQGTAW